MITIGCHPELALGFGKNTVIAHEPGNSVLAADNAVSPNFLGDSWAAVIHAAHFMDILDLFEQGFIRLFPETLGTILPRVVRAP